MNLSQASVQVRKIVIWIGIGAVSLIAIWFLWVFSQFLFKIIFPPPPPSPDMAFGKLPDLFQNNSSLANINFVLDTPGESLPTSPKMLPVYAVPQPKGELNSLNQAKSKARNAGLDSTPVRLSEDEWKWTSTKYPSRNLKLNIVTNNFIYTYDYTVDPSPLKGVFRTTDSETIRTARSFVSSFKALQNDLKKGPAKVTYLKINGTSKNVVGSYSEANAVQAELYRDKIAAKYPVVETDPQNSNIKVLFTSGGDNQLLELDYVYWYVDLKTFGTYPIKTSSEAFSDLKKGLASFAQGQDVNFETVNIYNISLAYLNPTSYTRFLQPVWVFKGDSTVGGEKKDFLAYVLAVSNSQIAR